MTTCTVKKYNIYLGVIVSKILTRVLLRKREKEIVFVQQKQSVPMSNNDFVTMNIFLCLKNSSYLQKWPLKMPGKRFLAKRGR